MSVQKNGEFGFLWLLETVVIFVENCGYLWRCYRCISDTKSTWNNWIACIFIKCVQYNWKLKQISRASPQWLTNMFTPYQLISGGIVLSTRFAAGVPNTHECPTLICSGMQALICYFFLCLSKWQTHHTVTKKSVVPKKDFAYEWGTLVRSLWTYASGGTCSKRTKSSTSRLLCRHSFGHPGMFTPKISWACGFDSASRWVTQ